MPLFVSLASLALAPGGIASLDLCADEYLLMFAPRERIASVSFLAASPSDSALSDKARGIPTNRGTMESLLASDAKVLLTTRPLGRLDVELAGRLGMRVVTLETGGPDVVAASARRVAALAGSPDRALDWHRRLRALEARQPRKKTRALWIGTGGVGMGPDGPSARWLSFAGIEPVQAAPGLSRVEQVVTSDAPLILRSRYDAGNYSHAGAYLDHPLVRKSGRRQIDVDGRRFTCSGPLLLAEIERLKREVGR